MIERKLYVPVLTEEVIFRMCVLLTVFSACNLDHF